MKKAASIIVMLVFLLSSATMVCAEYVNGHFNKKGTYVSGHSRKARSGSSFKSRSGRSGRSVTRSARNSRGSRRR
ncbi:MAG: hypothetical protein HQK99_02610 [Nitrospirae bacterium]|nr:hypothetical protein [Nitrospirota bacterium]